MPQNKKKMGMKIKLKKVKKPKMGMKVKLRKVKKKTRKPTYKPV